MLSLKKYSLVAVLAISLIASPIVAACSRGTKVLTFEGAVNYVALEDGFYGLVSDDGRKYDPVNLEPEYRVHGLRVRVKAMPAAVRENIHQWGTLVEIVEIREYTGNG